MKSFVGAAGIAAANASTLKLTWSDCGDSSTHTKITSFQPATTTSGTKTVMTGAGSIDEDVAGGTFDLEMKTAAGTVSCKGDASVSKTCNLPLGTGSLTFEAMTFPMKKGSTSVSVDLSLSALLPAALATTDTRVTATGTDGSKLFCMEIKSAPAAATSQGLPSTSVNATDGQCKFSSYEFCCGVGKACMCNMAKGGPKQCLSASYDYCCYKPHVAGYACDCSKGPHSGPIECKIINLACSKLFAKAVTSVVGCTLDDALVVATCEAVAMGPEDPLGDACAAILGITVEAGCVAMVNKGAAFTAAKCKSVAGCGSEESMVVV